MRQDLQVSRVSELTELQPVHAQPEGVWSMAMSPDVMARIGIEGELVEEEELVGEGGVSWIGG